jgi:engulfment/cell motility protein 1
VSSQINDNWLILIAYDGQYALTAMQNLMDFDYGWETLDEDFIFRVVQILASSSLINVCRPATAILKKLVEADPLSAPGVLASTSKGFPTLPPGSVYRYGFQIVFDQMKKERGLLETVVNRLGSADTAMAQYRSVHVDHRPILLLTISLSA